MKHPVDDREARSYLESLRFRLDVREPPNDRHRRLFVYQWNRAAQGEPMTTRTLDAKLTWANLGYRLGREHGPASGAAINSAFDRFASLYRRDAK